MSEGSDVLSMRELEVDSRETDHSLKSWKANEVVLVSGYCIVQRSTSGWMVATMEAHMLATRMAFLVFNLVALVLNSAALVQFLGYYTFDQNLIPAVLVFDMVAFPVVSWGAYKIGEMAEEQYRKEEQSEKLAVAAAASEANAQKLRDAAPPV